MPPTQAGRSSALMRIVILIMICMVPLVPARAQSPGGLGTGVQVGGDVSTSAGDGAAASTRIGSSSSGKGQSTTRIGGDVSTRATEGNSSTEIGGQDRDGTTVIQGNVINQGGQLRASGDTFIGGNVVTQKGAQVELGGCGAVSVSGDVVVPNGSLEVGCGCAGRRNGQCCIEFHAGFCVLQMVPPGEDGCPPGFLYSEGMCRLYSDFDHRVGN